MNRDNSNFLAGVEGDTNNSEHRVGWNDHLSQQISEWLRKDSRFFYHQSMSTPCLDVLQSASGDSFYNLDGKEYIDFHGNAVHHLGYGYNELIAQVVDQLQRLHFSPRRFTNKAVVEFVEELLNMLPDELCRILLVPSGSDAVSVALKIARAYTKKYKVISFWDSYHGASMDVASYSGESIFQEELGTLLPGRICIPRFNFYRKEVFETEEELINYIEYIFSKDPQIGAFLAEPIRNTDVLIPSSTFWARVKEICVRYGALLIFDEIPLAFGRTGKLFSFEHFNATPDLLCLGKGLGGGIIPQAAVIGREEFNIFSHISMGHYTHEKSPLGAAAGHALLKIIKQKNLLAKVQRDHNYLTTQLTQIQQEYEFIGEVRGIGMLWAIEIVKDKVAKDRDARMAERILYGCLDRGLSFKISSTNVIQWLPPLTAKQSSLEKALFIFKTICKSLKS